MKVELLDDAGKVLTEGTNAESVGILLGETSEANFYTVPVFAEAKEASLKFGEMKFLKKVFYEGKKYKLIVSIDEETESYPDIVIFNKDGTYKDYYPIDAAEDATIDFGEVTEDTYVYIGIFADDKETSYKLGFEEEGSIAGAEDEELFNETGFGKDGEISASFEQSGTPKPVMKSGIEDADDDGNAICFDYRSLYAGTSSIKRKLVLNEDKMISFSIKTDITYTYDGYLKFYIDGEEIESFTGKNGTWQTVKYIVPEGKHEIEWRAEGVGSSYTSGITNSVYIDNLKLLEIETISSFEQDFASSLPENWISKGIESVVIDVDPITSNWEQYGDAIVDTHGEIYKLATKATSIGDSSLQILNIKVSKDSALSFEYKMDLLKDSFNVYVDGELKFTQTTSSSGDGWRNGSVEIPQGSHVVEFKAKDEDNVYYRAPCTNAVYLDNINLISDTTDSVGIYPKGKQETYVNGSTIQFTANALRSDKSIRSNRNVSWSCTGGTISEAGLFTPGATAGTYTVTATIDGKEASNTTVIVHGENYLEESVTINGNTFTGYSGTKTSLNTDTISFDLVPSGNSFEVDGFFVLKGKVTNADTQNHALVVIESNGYKTNYILKDEFYERIWLRFGSGSYEIQVWDLTSINFSGDCPTGYGGFIGKTWTVTNTNSLEDAVYLLPSDDCQGDDYLVSNTINAILAELPENATVGQKLQALHDWQIHTLHYDNVSLNYHRKLQDAVTVLENQMAVCEGYANLYACFARAIGVKTKYQSSSAMNHGWVQCYYNGEWKLVDVTWDDPVSSNDLTNTEKNPYAENYKYFLIATDGVDGDHYSDITDPRSAVRPTQPLRLYGLDGWY